MKYYLFTASVLLIALLSSCAQAATPTSDAMMKATPTTDTMMANPSPTADAMMMKATPTAEAMMKQDSMMGKMPEQMTAPHFVSSSPKHGDALLKSPDKIVLTFNSALSNTSTINVTKEDGMAIGVGKLTLDDKMLTMSVDLPMNTADGLYLVKYKACWANQTCDNGQFAFKVDSKSGK